MTRVLVAIITGGRPALADRLTAALLPSLKASGLVEIEWIIRSDHAAAYEQDDHPLNVYPVEWASSFARRHWRHPTAVWEPDGFFGAFPGREWAMRTAEERGFDAVLQMDDNVKSMGILNATRPANKAVMTPGDLLTLLVEFAMSTNSYMTGAQLNSIPPSRTAPIIRPGYPYSVFVEKTGPGRMPYYGPFEDDIMHALEYGLNGGPRRTAAVVETIRYLKDSTNKSGGMRTQYNTQRGLEIARRYPANVKLRMGPATSAPNDPNRGVRHFLNSRGFTPIRVTDADRFATANESLRVAVAAAVEAKLVSERSKMKRRAEVS